QIFIDQAMRVPKLVLGAELTATPDPDASVAEIPGFTRVSGRRGDLPEFSGIEHQPGEDVRILSTLGFINLPEEGAADLHVPLLFQYRGDVIPSFALQAALLWMRLTPGEVKIDIGSAITLPNGTKIPIRSDGTLLINSRTVQRARRITLNELLLAAQQHESGAATAIRLEDTRTHLMLVRVETNAPDLFAAAIGAIQTNSFVRRVSWIFDCAMVVIAAAFSGALRRFSRIDLIIGAIAFSAAFGLIGAAIYIEDRYLPGRGLQVALDQIARLYTEAEQSKRCVICRTHDEISRTLDSKKIGFLITLEGVEPLGDDLDLLRAFYELG